MWRPGLKPRAASLPNQPSFSLPVPRPQNFRAYPQDTDRGQGHAPLGKQKQVPSQHLLSLPPGGCGVSVDTKNRLPHPLQLQLNSSIFQLNQAHPPHLPPPYPTPLFQSSSFGGSVEVPVDLNRLIVLKLEEHHDLLASPQILASSQSSPKQGLVPNPLPSRA
jgi:hypothetical protein